MSDEASLIVRWLCHDMATPVATLQTATELLGDAGDAEINELITAAVRKLSARLRMVRLALGTGGSSFNAAMLEKLLAEALPDTPLTLAPDITALPSSKVAGAALVLSDLNRFAPIEIDAAGARWTNADPLPQAARTALSGKAQGDARGAMIALVAEQNRKAGLVFAAEPCGIGFRLP